MATLVAATSYLVAAAVYAPHTIVAYFSTVTAIYPGDDVRVAGVKVGSIKTIVPDGEQMKVLLHVDRDAAIPADAKAILVAPNLVSARYIQLTPAYEDIGPTMSAGAVIPRERTAVPVEWDEVKEQLTRLATDLGPNSTVSTPAVARFIDSAASAMDGNGDKLRQTLTQLSGMSRIISDGSGNIVDTLTNLQIFVSALRDSNIQIVQFQDRLASLTSVLDGSRSDLDAALTGISFAVGEVQRFISQTRDPAAEQIQRLANVTQNVVDHQIDLENVLHVAPNAIANGYNIYNPDTGDAIGAFVLNNFSNPVAFLCSAIGAIENTTAPETAKLCTQYLGPALNTISMNYLPIPINPLLAKSYNPDNLIYSDPALAPGSGGPSPNPPEIPPAVSAYTGVSGPPTPGPAPTVAEMLLPAEAPAAPPPGQPATSTEGNPPS
ncbi:mammalian cell entry protein [Mycolicibacterium conceptionense]|uniref:Mammalian cell entry protein n=1 Tax=Mycolicibacterium conceptionense TaxID=451644 RepID=A0ABX3V4H1_9MYCO|nr:MCE family protein [Mycolicibacterium conceptionense]ORV24638.1 mammalian cell entry protein [Mycolicibacterium conceptionense]